MRSTDKKRGRYYEHYQVEDVLTFFSGQLISAKSPDGMQVLLQEITANKTLPSGLKELLTNLDNEHLAPVLDVIEEQDRIVLVHPPLKGEPLFLLVEPRHGMDPAQALSIFQKLLRTAVRLEKSPIPLFTTLHPRNIILEGNRPFVLFVSFEKFSKNQADEKWRFLLYFLLTGFQLDQPLTDPESDRNIRELPKPLKDLVLLSMDPEQTMESVLEVAEQTAVPKTQKSSSPKRKVPSKKLVYPAVAVVLLIVGAIFGGQLIWDNEDAAAEIEKEAERELRLKGKSTYSDISFNDEKPVSKSLPPSIKGSFHIFGELVQKEGKPFSISLASENVDSNFGLQVDEEGTVRLFQFVSGETFDLTKTGNNFKIEPNHKYRMDVYYIPGQPFRVAVSEVGKDKKWVAVGKVPIESRFKVELKGVKGTHFNRPTISEVQTESESLSTWMNWQPWLLIKGNGVIKDNVFDVSPNSHIQMKDKNASFAFKREDDFVGDPLQLELESADGDRYLVNWLEDGKVELMGMGYKSLGSIDMQTDWSPTTESRVSVTNESGKMSIELEHNNVKRSIHTYFSGVKRDDNQSAYVQTSTPIQLKHISIITKDKIYLMNE